VCEYSHIVGVLAHVLPQCGSTCGSTQSVGGSGGSSGSGGDGIGSGCHIVRTGMFIPIVYCVFDIRTRNSPLALPYFGICVMMAAYGRASTFAGATVQEPPTKKAKRMTLAWYIYVNLPSGSTITLACTPESTVCNVKRMIFAREGYPHDLQRMFFNGQELIDCPALLTDYNLQEGSILRLVCGRQIVVQTLDGEGMVFEVDGDNTIEEVKAMIRDRLGTPICLQKLMYKNFTLEDGTALADNDVRNLGMVYLKNRGVVDD
jgi:hypothetical protein